MKTREERVSGREESAAQSLARAAAREEETDAAIAVVEAASEDLLDFGESDHSGGVKLTKNARSHPAWDGLVRRNTAFGVFFMIERMHQPI